MIVVGNRPAHDTSQKSQFIIFQVLKNIKRVYRNDKKIYLETFEKCLGPVYFPLLLLKCDFKNVALHIFRTPFTKNISEGQPLYLLILYFCVIRLLDFFFFFHTFPVLIPEIRNQKSFITYICTYLIVYFSQFRVFLHF